MLGRIIFLIIVLIFIFAVNAKDYVGWQRGDKRFIQVSCFGFEGSGFLSTTLILLSVPMLVFGLKDAEMLWGIIILELIYIIIYTLCYFKFQKKLKEEKIKDKNKRRKIRK